MPWYAIYTQSRSEKKVAEKLQKLGVEVYCPLVTQIKQWSDRKKKVQTPLLPSYVFVNLDESKRDLVYQVNGFVRYLFWLGKPAIIRENEIETLKRWLQNSVISTYEIQNLEIGSSYTITSGPFNGKEGKISKIDNNYIEIILKNLGFKVILKK